MKLELYLMQLTPNALEHSYAEGKWTARQIFAHLADTEFIYGFRLRQMLTEDNHQIQLVDQDAWASRYEKLEPSLAFELFRSARLWNLALLATYDLQDWLKDAQHSENGVMSMDLMVRMLAAHDLSHLAQLELIVGQLKEE